MSRRDMLASVLGLFAITAAPRSAQSASAAFPLALSKAEWRKRLPAERFRVLFEEGTEYPHSSPLNAEKRPGTFVCAACKQPLFDSAHKYDSGTGWPSFWQSLPNAVGTTTDYKLVYPRTEYHCSRCGGHQGHIFDDGPAPTGKRFCNNGVALEFVVRGEALPALAT